ncbi:RHS repeat-associated core domain-containing protein [Paenibacillus thiaminolyticus]|nr:RHS repeat-associated core domain-containing protein [Paenibacillus thiaminolyticus]
MLLVARQIPGQSSLQYYVTNGHGDIMEIQDAIGKVLNRYTCDIWGNPLKQEEQVPNIFRYSGEYWDAATELQYLRARWYDPGIGRFLTEDAYEGEINNPLSLNLYTYVHNNPLIYTDPSGHKVWLIHGTFSDGDTWSPEFVTYLKDLFNETTGKLDWSGKNKNDARSKAAEEMLNKVYEWHKENPNDSIRLVGHKCVAQPRFLVYIL